MKLVHTHLFSQFHQIFVGEVSKMERMITVNIEVPFVYINNT
jgi:hypothetical protein